MMPNALLQTLHVHAYFGDKVGATRFGVSAVFGGQLVMVAPTTDDAYALTGTRLWNTFEEAHAALEAIENGSNFAMEAFVQ